MQNDSLSTPTTTPTPPNPAEPELSDSERRQRAIVSFFADKIKDLLKDAPISLNALEKTPDYPSYRHFFLEHLRSDRITTTDETSFLESIPGNLETLGSRRIYDFISRSTREKQILAVVTGHNSTNWHDTVASDIDAFLTPPARGKTDYRTPVGFAELRRRFLSEIQNTATPEQLDAYISAMNSFESNLYGERFAYYREFELLRKEALALDRGADATSLAEATTVTEDISAAVTAAEPVAPSNLPTSRLTPVSDEHREQLLSHTLVDGDPWRQSGSEYRLSVPNLISAGLVPKYELSLSGQTIYLSNLWELTSEQMAALGFIPTPEGVKVRGYYRDKNTGLWRYLPDYVRGNGGDGIDTFGVGFDEHSVTLPIVLQYALNQIERQRNVLKLENTNPDFLLAGTAVAYDTRQDLLSALSHHNARGDFYGEVSNVAYNIEASNLIAPNRHKNAPQLISINANLSPNFAQPIARYSVYSALAGQILGEGFWSNDRSAAWLFCSDYRGRSWVALQETTSPVTSTGCRKEWYLPTDITTPLYESTLLADSYGDPTDTRAGNYICMWNNYLSKVPFIQDYTTTLRR